MRALTAALIVCTSTAALGQNAVSRQLLASTEAQKNAAFTRQLKGMSEKCDEVIKTQFNGSAGEIDDWEAKCRNGSTYSFSIPSRMDQQVRVMTCEELKAASVAFGAKKEPLGCQIK